MRVLLCILLAVVFQGVSLRDVTLTEPAGAATGDLFSESFDGATEDETWTESTAGTGWIDMDDTTNPPVGSATGFTTQAVNYGNTSYGTARFYADIGSNPAIVYISYYFYLDSEEIDASENYDHFGICDTSATSISASCAVFIQLREDVSNVLHLYAAFNGDYTGAGIGTTAISLDTSYLVRVKYDTTNNQYAWYVNGTEQASGSASMSTTHGRVIIGDYQDDAIDQYIDKIEIDSTAFIDTP